MQKIALYGALIGAISMSAQTAAIAPQILASEPIPFSASPVKGAPYSGQSVNETVRVLADGNRIARTTSTTIYRDSQGRVRSEQMSSGSNPTVQSISITDPVENVSYTLNPATKIARKNSLPPVISSFGESGTVSVGNDGEFIFSANSIAVTSDGVVTLSDAKGSKNPSSAQVEKLGTKTIEGVPAEGVRRTITLPAGAIGNEQPIVTVTERWYSQELQTLMMSSRSDPRTGTTTYKLINVNRTEPSPDLFQLPPGYTLKARGSVFGPANKNEQ